MLIIMKIITMAARKKREWTKSDVRELKSLAKKVPARQIARRFQSCRSISC